MQLLTDKLFIHQNKGKVEKILVDSESFRRRALKIVENTVHRSRWEANRYGAADPHGELETLVAKAEEFIEVNDGQKALIVLEAVTAVFVVDMCTQVWVDECCFSFLYALDMALTEAVLVTSLDNNESARLLCCAESWADNLLQRGVDDSICIALCSKGDTRTLLRS